MATWQADPGGASAYNPTSMTFNHTFVKFTTPGCVPTEATTRFQYRDVFSAVINVVVTDADITTAAARGQRNTGMLYVLPASYFGAGVIPKPSHIIWNCRRGNGYMQRARQWGPPAEAAGDGPFNVTYNFDRTTNMRLQPNTLYWVLAAPVYYNGDVNNLGDATPAGNTETTSRGVSLWTNRTPLAPDILTPRTGLAIAENETFELAIRGNDPDAVFPGTTAEDKDWAGVQVQYADKATKNGPAPLWRDLLFGNPTGTAFEPGWSFKGNTHFGAEVLRQTGKVPVGGGTGTIVPGHGALPAGDWQIRVRTFDFGHPYPATENPGAAGLVNPTPDTYYALNTSPWSTPVNVSVTTRVPHPVLLSPTDGRAVAEGALVTLSWRYRNTATPPSAQAGRTVQIRKVGDPGWSILADGTGTEQTILAQAPVSGVDYIPSGGFEDADLGGWEYRAYNPANSGSLSVATGSYPESRSGTSAMRVAPVGGPGVAGYLIALDPDDVSLSVKVSARTEASNGRADVYLIWRDETNYNVVGASAHLGFVSGTAWKDFSLTNQAVPAGARYAELMVSTGGDPIPFRVDDASVIAKRGTEIFALEATTQYEWRVQTEDATGARSNYGTPARFWVVPAPVAGAPDDLPLNTVSGATLGCGTHTVEIYRRGGLRRAGVLKNLTLVDWERKRDDISTAKIIVGGWDIDCGNLLSLIEPWAYEIVIFRDNGFTVDRVWEGPITLITHKADTVEIHAKDVMAYAYRRVIHQAMNDLNSGGDTVVSRAARVLQNVFAPDDPNVLRHLTVLSKSDDSKQFRNAPAFSRTAFEEVDDMASNSGLDYTVVGRAILVWGTKHRIGTLPEFRDKDLGSSPIVSIYGMSTANRYIVSDGNGIYGLAEAEGAFNEDGVDETYGLLEMLSSSWAEDSETPEGGYTQEQADKTARQFAEFAARSVSDRYPPPVVVRIPDNTTLNPGAVISIQHLVPGVVIPLHSTGTLRSVVANQKLDSIKVIEQAGEETISITMSPFTRDDAATPELEAE